jgi:hypothetical protein
MEPTCEEATSEQSTRGGAREVGRVSSERGQKAGEPRKWSQGRPGQKPEEENRRPAKRPPAAGAASQGGVSAVIASIRGRFGYRAIGLGYGGIRFTARALR